MAYPLPAGSWFFAWAPTRGAEQKTRPGPSVRCLRHFTETWTFQGTAKKTLGTHWVQTLPQAAPLRRGSAGLAFFCHASPHPQYDGGGVVRGRSRRRFALCGRPMSADCKKTPSSRKGKTSACGTLAFRSVFCVLPLLAFHRSWQHCRKHRSRCAPPSGSAAAGRPFAAQAVRLVSLAAAAL